MDKIGLRSSAHGHFETTPEALDLMIGSYLPTSVQDLEKLIAERLGEARYPLTSVIEGLMVLAELDGYATN